MNREKSLVAATIYVTLIQKKRPFPLRPLRDIKQKKLNGYRGMFW
jgi:hypothetical protein